MSIKWLSHYINFLDTLATFFQRVLLFKTWTWLTLNAALLGVVTKEKKGRSCPSDEEMVSHQLPLHCSLSLKDIESTYRSGADGDSKQKNLDWTLVYSCRSHCTLQLSDFERNNVKSREELRRQLWQLLTKDLCFKIGELGATRINSTKLYEIKDLTAEKKRNSLLEHLQQTFGSKALSLASLNLL